MTTDSIPGEQGYAEALDELDRILGELEGSDVDVDRLADRALCRDRISGARLQIDHVIADLDASQGETASGNDGTSLNS